MMPHHGTRRLLVAALLTASAACAGSEPVATPPPPPAAPLALSVSAASRSVAAIAGYAAPGDNVVVILSGGDSATTPWVATSHHAWNTITAPVGTGTGTLAWSRSVASLPPGLYIDTITISAGNAIGSPAQLVDSLRVVATPTVYTLLVSPLSRRTDLVYGDTAIDGSAQVSVLGNTNRVLWTATNAQTWNAVVPPTGASVNSTQQFVWKRNVAGLTPGTYVDIITLRAPGISGPAALGSPAQIYDTIVIAPGPGPLTLAVTPTFRTTSTPTGQGAHGDSLKIGLTGKNAAITSWTVTSRQPWTTLNASAGSGPVTIRWTRNTASLSPGIYRDTITVSAPGAAGSPIVLIDTIRVVGPAPTAPFALTTQATWAGGRIAIHSAEFHARGAGSILRLGSAAVELTRQDDTTFAAFLPTTLSGVFATQLDLDGYAVPLQPLTINGYTGTRVLNTQIIDDVVIWPTVGHAQVMGNSDRCVPDVINGVNVERCYPGITLLDLESGAETTYDSVPNFLRAPGVTFRDSVFLITDNSGTRNARLLPSLVNVLGDVFAGFAGRQLMEMSPNVWFVSSHHNYSITGSAAVASGEQAEETEGVYLSPRRDRATIRVDRVGAGVPVFDAATGAVAYRAGSLTNSEDAAFSRDGDLLAMVGGTVFVNQGASRIVLLKSATGAVLRDTVINRTAFAIALDPVRPLVYVGVVSPDQHPSVIVLDRGTFGFLGEMRAADDANLCNTSCYKGVILSGTSNDLYVFWSWNGRPRAYRFTLPH